MSITSHDAGGIVIPAKKYGGRVQFTYEILHKLLCLPKEAKLTAVVDDQGRDIVSFKFHTEEAKRGISYEVGEGMEYPNIHIPMEQYGMDALRLADEIRHRARLGGKGNEWCARAVKMYESEDEENA
jgi:hypothetical protein